MISYEQLTHRQIEDIRTFDKYVDDAQLLEKQSVRSEKIQKRVEDDKREAHELHYNTTRHLILSQTLVDGEVVSLLSTRLKQRGIPQWVNHAYLEKVDNLISKLK